MARQPLTPEQRALRARMGAYAMHAKNDPKVVTAAGRAAAFRRFEDEVDPDRVLPDEERRRRARLAQRAHMTRIAFLSSRARQGRAAKKVETS